MTLLGRMLPLCYSAQSRKVAILVGGTLTALLVLGVCASCC